MAILKKPKTGFQDQLWLNVGQKYCRMLQGELPGERSAILLTFIMLILYYVYFELPFYTGFTVQYLYPWRNLKKKIMGSDLKLIIVLQ